MSYPEKYDVPEPEPEKPKPKPKPTFPTELVGKIFTTTGTGPGVEISPGGVTVTRGTTTTGTLATGGLLPPLKPSKPLPPRPVRVIPAPTQAPRKVVIAFLDENDEIEWCAKVRPDSINTRFGGDPMETPEMDICFKLVEADDQ